MANALHLSKLSRGHVEFSESGSRLEIYPDSNEKPLMHSSKPNQCPYIPKTYSTKRGPLVIFAETDFMKNSKSKSRRDRRLLHHNLNSPSLISPPPLKYGELKRSILAYGGTPENQLADGVVDEDGTYINMKIPSKKRSHASKYAGISPSVAIKRRFMIASHEDKKRDIDSILDSDYSASRSHRYSMMKTHILSDEISLIPPIYRNPDLAQNSPVFVSDNYRFFKIENSTCLNGLYPEETERMNSPVQHPLQIFDSKGAHLSYETLAQSEKEKILADLLIQTALQNIADQQNIEIFEDALNRVRDSDMSQSYSTMDIPLVDESTLTFLQLETRSDRHQHHKNSQAANQLLGHENYMFGKMPGSRWARNRQMQTIIIPTKGANETCSNEQQTDTSINDELNTAYTQTMSDFVHSKVMRASRLLAPLPNSSHQEFASTRHQPNPPVKLPTKLRKSLDTDSVPNKLTVKTRRKSVDHGSFKHHLTPIQVHQDHITTTNQLIEKDKSLLNLFNRQHSSKSSKQDFSRIGTGKTFATDRCGTSPLSIQEEAERLLTIASIREENDNDHANDNNNKNDTNTNDNISRETTLIDPTEDTLLRNVTRSPGTKTDEEHDQHVHPSAMNITENSIIMREPNFLRSAYTHRSRGTEKSKNSAMVPPGALLIAPDGEVLLVSGPSGHPENVHVNIPIKHDPFSHHHHSANSIVVENSDQQGITAPCVPIVLGTKRERLPDETVIRRTLNLNGGDVNCQIDLQSWSFDLPLEKRRIVPSQSHALVPAPPPVGLSPFTGRKHHHQKRIAQEIQDHAVLQSTLSMHSEAIPTQQQQQQQQQPRTRAYSNSKTRLGAESQLPLFAFTSWAYQQPRTPPVVKRPYLYKPDYRPSGAHGSKHPIGDTETLIRRTINVHAGDIDASLSFTIWVYDMWINDLVKNGADPNYVKQVKGLFDLFKQRRLSKVDLQDKDFLTALANHAQSLARIILKRTSSGHHLAQDAQFAIIENLRNLKYLLDERLESLSDDDYREILRETLGLVLSKGSLEHLKITDDVLMALMDYPIEAFEIYIDPDTGDEHIRIKSAYLVRRNKIKGKVAKKKTKTVIISEEISTDDFDPIFDETNGEYIYRLKKDFAEQKGFMDLIEANFDIVPDEEIGAEIVKIKSLPNYNNLTGEHYLIRSSLEFNGVIEIFFDPDTGKQILVLKKEVSKTPPVIQSDIAMDDFEFVKDEKTGETVLRLKLDAAARKGLTGLANTNFEVVIDPTTGQKVVRIKDDGQNETSRNRVEIVTDAKTGKQTIRMIAPIDDADESDEPIVTVTENCIDLNDFERVIDPKTGREILRMKADVIKAKGLDELANAVFEIVIDPVTGQQRIVLKSPSSSLSGGTNTTFEIIVDIVTGVQKIIKRTIIKQDKDDMDIIESQLNVNDFERVIDPNTGLEVLRLKKGAAARKGLTDLLDVQFEMVTGADGKQTIVIKGGGKQGSAGDAQFELITDASGRTTIKVKKERPPTPELEVTEKEINLEDFEEVIDVKTGMKVLKLKVDVAKRAGMMDLLDAQFETYIDPKTGKQAIRVKQGDNSRPNDVKFEIVTDASGKQSLRMIQEIPKTIEVTNLDVNASDFEEIVDNKTGKKVLRMKKEVARRKGFVDMDSVDFEFVIDKNTGQQVIQMKTSTGKVTKGNVTYEMVIDPKTGQQTLRRKEEVDVQFETIEDDLANEDFEEFIDEVTGERVLKLTAAAAARKGLDDLRDVEFEVYTDPNTGKEQIRVKGGNQTGKLGGKQKFEFYVDEKTGLPRIVLKRPKGRTPPPVEASIDENDFEKVTDPVTGKEFYRFTDQAIRRKGLSNVKDLEFDIEVDTETGKTIMKPKVNVLNGQKVEMIIDPQTGEQTIRFIPQKHVEKTATITTTIDLDQDAFTVRIDPKTGKEVFTLSQNVMESYGLENIEFEQVVDEKTGETVFRMKPAVGKDGKVYELVTDPTTGKQSLQVKETVTKDQLANIIESREARGLRIPRTNSGFTRMSALTEEERNFLPSGISTRTKKKESTLSPDDDTSESPVDSLSDVRRQSQAASKQRPIRVKSPSGQDDGVDWTSDDEKQLDGLSTYEQRRRKEQMIAEKKRRVAEMKRQEEFAIQNRLKKQRESLVDVDRASDLLNADEQERVAQWERDLRKLDIDREGLTDEEYQERRKKLFSERTRVLKAAYDRKMDRLKRQKGIPDGTRIEGEQAAQLDAQIRAEEETLLSMMNAEEREDYIRARNEERARQRLLAERERFKRGEELQAALAETKRMATIRAAEIMAKELQHRSNNVMYAELKDLVTEQKVSRAFTYSYFSLLQFLASSSSNHTH
ncbi:unnamed protein product [Rotaria socialis]|uniref:Uncharacterized protein n=1 Tax=Rotaria socialis TaxID=392032 RepID=A0A820KCM6_9BILA|nr:unnamed protein product [Rotaria socialis]